MRSTSEDGKKVAIPEPAHAGPLRLLAEVQSSAVLPRGSTRDARSGHLRGASHPNRQEDGALTVPTLLTDEARAWANRAYPVHTVSVTTGDIRRFATATGETDPIHFDTEAARAAGHRDIVAPPMFYVLLRVQPYHLRPRDELEPDGSPSEDIPPVKISGAMAGETRLQLFRPFMAGDEITCRKRLLDMTEKVGRSGQLLLLTFEYRYEDDHGEPVAIEIFTRILR